MTEWLLTPLSGASQHDIEWWASWHARLMVVSWGVLLPLGALAARYFKVLPKQRWPEELDNRGWWHAHRVLQFGGIGLMSVGVALAWNRGAGGTTLAQLHGWMGWLIVALGWLQLIYGLRRGSKGGPTDVQLRGDHYDMTTYRLWFERIHKSVGWLSILAAIGVMVLGLIVSDAPRWMALVLTLWWLLLAGAAWRLQREGRCIDTYQAIWGADPKHPGNRLKPIGWGVRRPGH
jgi:Eukaryotic cytochrome b561